MGESGNERLQVRVRKWTSVLLLPWGEKNGSNGKRVGEGEAHERESTREKSANQGQNVRLRHKIC